MGDRTPSMSRGHFELIGDLLHEIGERQGWSEDQYREAAKVATSYVAGSNPLFRPEILEARVRLGSQQWAVIVNMPGFLPDSEPATFETRKDAERSIIDLMNEYREDGYLVRGSSKLGYEIVRRGGELMYVAEIVDLAYQ